MSPDLEHCRSQHAEADERMYEEKRGQAGGQP